MAFDPEKYRVVVASDVSTRDGIGVEIYSGEEFLIEIFRDDTKKSRDLSVFVERISVEEMEGFIQIFKDRVPWEFID